MDDYYDEDQPSSTATEPMEREDKPKPNTALLPKSFFKDKELEPGKECKLRVEHVYDDEVAVSYVSHGTDDEPEPDELYD